MNLAAVAPKMVLGDLPLWRAEESSEHIHDCMFQEGFGLSSSPLLRRRGTGCDVILFEAGLQMRFVPKQAVWHGPSM